METNQTFIDFILKSSGILGFIFGIISLMVSNKVKTRSEEKLAKLKSELNRVEIEQNTKFSQVYSIRVSAIRDLYKKLVHAEGSFLNVLKPLHWKGEDSIDNKIDRATKDGNDLNIYFTENEILFSDKTSELVKKIQEEFIIRWSEYQSMEFIKDSLDGQERAEKATKQWDNFQQTFKKTIPELKKNLQAELRSELGLEPQ